MKEKLIKHKWIINWIFFFCVYGGYGTTTAKETLVAAMNACTTAHTGN
jgi:hypothetical protein